MGMKNNLCLLSLIIIIYCLAFLPGFLPSGRVSHLLLLYPMDLGAWYITYISVSRSIPIGSNRPQWAAGEYVICKFKATFFPINISANMDPNITDEAQLLPCKKYIPIGLWWVFSNETRLKACEDELQYLDPNSHHTSYFIKISYSTNVLLKINHQKIGDNKSKQTL